jgi:phage terminase small subunit
MPERPLTPKMERFAIEYVATGNASEAYRRAYDAENMLPTTIHVQASLLLDNDKVAKRVNEEKALVLAPVRASAAWIVEQAASIALDSDAPHSARVQALTLLSKRFPDFRDGITIDNRTVNLSGLSQEQLEAIAGALQAPKETE